MLWMYSAMATVSAGASVSGGVCLADGRADQFAVLIGERDARAQQVGAVGAAAQVGRMAARAVRFVQPLAADQHVLRRERRG